MKETRNKEEYRMASAIKQKLEGLYRTIARNLNINYRNVYNWIKGYKVLYLHRQITILITYMGYTFLLGIIIAVMRYIECFCRNISDGVRPFIPPCSLVSLYALTNIYHTLIFHHLCWIYHLQLLRTHSLFTILLYMLPLFLVTVDKILELVCLLCCYAQESVCKSYIPLSLSCLPDF